ncbi:hypothetical protein CYMTET_56744 [Cymbomonas tetramitiformis]|uniref:Uncharacterized protein n=1 Tax=Cymbomonas tetramitiformis TaxID=36881 RepID=A0AAE0EM93_9CHLO|nr:hypothetical protein CYMTET_56744 [Cymbomonas tetramitiformis]
MNLMDTSAIAIFWRCACSCTSKSHGVKELRGMAAHFSHNIVNVKLLLHSSQEKNDLVQTRPPKDNDTRNDIPCGDGAVHSSSLLGSVCNMCVYLLKQLLRK